jgi:hypothetical protein
MEAIKLNEEVDIFSDDFIKKLYAMKPFERDHYFCSLFPNLEMAHKYDSNPAPQIGKSDFQNPKGWVNVDSLPPYQEGWSRDDYLRLVENYVDPYEIITKEHEGVIVVRDDLLPGRVGSKARYAEALMQKVEQKYVLYAGVPTGQAMVTLARACKKYNKMLICISPNRKEPTQAHLETMDVGAIYMYYQTGGQAGARKRCRAFINDQLGGNGLYVPAGVKNPIITAGFVKSAMRLEEIYNPDVVFCVASTGVMSHSLSIALPNAEIHAIQVAGNSSTKKFPGRLNVTNHNQPFNERVKKEFEPPFNSVLNYDAKGWKYCKEYKKNNPDKVVLFWNVMGEPNA